MVDAFGSNRVKLKPPERGVFALDHDNECKESAVVYLKCLKEHAADHLPCRTLAASYLKCRMDHNLMREEDPGNLGFDIDLGSIPDRATMTKSLRRQTVSEHRDSNANTATEMPSKEQTGFIAGTGVKTTNKWIPW